MVVKHVVMWKLKDSFEGKTRQENAKKARDMLLALKKTIPEIKDMEVGININSTPGSYDLVLISTHASKKDLEKYMNNYDHKKVADFINTIRESRVLVDYET